MMWIAVVTTTAAMALLAAAVILRVHERISRRTFYALCAAANLTNLTVCVALTSTIGSAVNTAALAVNLWLWWHDGGGDDTKRRLREWGRKFEGVRRTPPVTAS